MSALSLSIAIGEYDHVRDLLSGQVRAEGIDLLPSKLPVEEIFYRFTHFQEWDVSEMSFGKYVALTSQDKHTMVAIPIFPSRSFRQSSIYVRAGGDITSPQQLAGKRVGVPEWAQTASIYTRGYFVDTIGIPLGDIQWIQAGVNEPGRKEKVELRLPPGVSYTAMPDRTLNDLLIAGEIEAIFSARPPKALTDGTGAIVRLFDDYPKVERQYFAETGIFPIMHVIAIRRSTFERHPWIAMNLFKAFSEAKDRSLARALDVTTSSFPIPWAPYMACQAQKMFGGNLWDYGIDPNRTTIDAFLRFSFEQGVAHRRMAVEDLFPKQLQTSVRV